MATQWYCKIGRRKVGPISSDQLKAMAREGEVDPKTEIRQAGAQSWVLASRVKGLFSSEKKPAGPPSSDARKPLRKAAPLRPPAAAPAAVAAPPAARRAVPPPAAPIANRPTTVGPTATPTAVSAAPIPAGLPVGQALPPSAAAPASVTVAGAADGQTHGIMGERAARRRGGKAGLIAAIGGIVFLIVAGGLAVYLATRDNDEDPGAAVAGKDSDPDAREADHDPDADPDAEKQKLGAVEAAKQGIARRTQAEKERQEAERAAADTARAAEAKTKRKLDVVRSVRRWQSRMGGAKGIAKIDIVDAWVGSSPTGRTAPSEDGSPRYVFVKLSLTNDSKTDPLHYTSWNGDGDRPDQTTAIMVDTLDNVCDSVPYSELEADGRKRTVGVDPGEKITDLLVFRAPPGDFEDLRLVLPFDAVGLPKKTYGFRLTQDLLRGTTQNSTKPPVAGVPDNEPVVTQPDGSDTDHGNFGEGDKPDDGVEQPVNIPPSHPEAGDGPIPIPGLGD